MIDESLCPNRCWKRCRRSSRKAASRPSGYSKGWKASSAYWAVDPDYDGEVFRSVWQDYRENTANDGDALRVVTKAEFSVPHKASARRICVRAVDVFGFEAEAVQTVTELAP